MKKKEIRKKLGINLKKARNSCGLSQEELAVTIGKKSATYISFIESGQRNISAIDLILISKALGENINNLTN